MLSVGVLWAETSRRSARGYCYRRPDISLFGQISSAGVNQRSGFFDIQGASRQARCGESDGDPIRRQRPRKHPCDATLFAAGWLVSRHPYLGPGIAAELGWSSMGRQLRQLVETSIHGKGIPWQLISIGLVPYADMLLSPVGVASPCVLLVARHVEDVLCG